jgi:hypothetical protein
MGGEGAPCCSCSQEEPGGRRAMAGRGEELHVRHGRKLCTSAARAPRHGRWSELELELGQGERGVHAWTVERKGGRWELGAAARWKRLRRGGTLSLGESRQLGGNGARRPWEGRSRAPCCWRGEIQGGRRLCVWGRGGRRLWRLGGVDANFPICKGESSYL